MLISFKGGIGNVIAYSNKESQIFKQLIKAGKCFQNFCENQRFFSSFAEVKNILLQLEHEN